MAQKSAIWQLGFRPFFLGGALFSCLAITLWIGFLFGGLPYVGAMDPVTWHSHEMVYGFSTAIIAGFILTAVQNWTGMRGVHGLRLQGIFALWLVARLLLLAPQPYYFVGAGLDLAFFPVLATLLIPYLKDPELKVERVFLVFFLLFFLGNLLVHLQIFELFAGQSRRGVLLGLDTVILIITFIGGRVIPFFSESSVTKAQPKTWKSVEILCHISTGCFLVTRFFLDSSAAHTWVCFIAAAIHMVRLSGWQVRRIRRVPILWILHLAYLWVVAGFVFTGLASIGWIAPSLAIHAFTVGAISTVIYGMISRVSLGHSGRPLRPSISVVVGYYLLTCAAIVRVFVPVISSDLHDAAVLSSSALWIIAFGIFLVTYWPFLTQPRPDGREG